MTYDPDDGQGIPAIHQLEIEWLYAFPAIDSIVDVPEDQGGWVRVYFGGSAYDQPGTPEGPVTGYNVFRRVDLPEAVLQEAERILADPAGDDGSVEAADDGRISAENNRGFPMININGREIVPASLAASAGMPPGDWEAVEYMMALQQDEYICLVPTLEDSSASYDGTVYCVVAQTADPMEWYAGPPDSGYSVDNIAPGVPGGFSVAYNTGSGNTLDWDDSTEDDFQYYRVYRGSSGDFEPGPGTLVHETTVSDWIDPEYDGWQVYYKVTALD